MSVREKSAPHDTFYPYRKTDEVEQEKLDAGYKFLGWQRHRGNSEELKNCTHPHQSKQHSPTGGNVTYWCDECKLVWKIDMSD